MLATRESCGSLVDVYVNSALVTVCEVVKGFIAQIQATVVVVREKVP